MYFLKVIQVLTVSFELSLYFASLHLQLSAANILHLLYVVYSNNSNNVL